MLAADHRGLGPRMVGEMEVRARRAAAGKLTLKVSTKNNRARKFYERAGFADLGTANGYHLLEKQL